MAGAKTTGERLALFSQFGTPAIIFEAHSNNQVGGTFTYVLYQESAINVDWMLIPQALARQEHPSLLLFDKVGIPEQPHPEPERPQERIERASTHEGIFWQLAASNVLNLHSHYLVKYLI